MALLTLVTPVWGSGNAEKTALYSVRGVNTGDSVDVSVDFIAPKMALFLCTTTGQKGVCTIAGSVVTIPTNSLNQDAGYLLVWGSSS